MLKMKMNLGGPKKQYTRVNVQNGILIGLAAFAGLTAVTREKEKNYLPLKTISKTQKENTINIS